VNKVTCIISLCAVLASGCALFDFTESDPARSSAAAPSPQLDSLPVAVGADTAAQESPRKPLRVLTREEVRQLQLRLKSAGFDPGPADGVVGARTKGAFNRYYTGCAQVKPLLNDFDDSGAAATENSLKKKPLDLQEVQGIQTQLKAAGFDPGPADGIFGLRTKRTLAHLKSNCPMMSEFAGTLNESVASAGNKNVGAQAQSPASSAPSVVTQTAAAAAPVRATEEVRILQLRLRDAGFDPGPFDGMMGPKTKSALQQYEASQRGKKLKTSLQGNISGQY
jgi:peptidoglycan hydrolase-like protein with peptidoglycan-binding domain